MNKSRFSIERITPVAFLPLAMLLPACTVYQDSPAPSVPAAYIDATPADDSGYVVIRSDDDFYEPLSPYGHWEEVGDEGRCWVPDHVEQDWRPYSNGSWRRTDAGWYWDSDEPWGWATYHYGRWDRDDRFGWYWIPETQWAPSWVSWHQGGGYVGWAPLRPSNRSRRGGSVDVRIESDSPSQAYVFVQEKQFLQPVRRANVIVNNTTIINQTTNITNIKVVNKTVINEGPRTEVIERATGEKVQSFSARTVRQEHEARVAVPHAPPNKAGVEKTARPGPSNPPVHPAGPASGLHPTPAAPKVAPKEKQTNRDNEPRRVSPEGPPPEKQIHPEGKFAGDRRMDSAPPAEQPRPRNDEARPKVEKPKKPAPKPQPKHVKEALPEPPKRDSEKHENEKEPDAADQHGRSDPSR